MLRMEEMRYRLVPEETLWIDLPGSGGLKIRGVLRGSLDDPLVVMMHGRPGDEDSALMYVGAAYLHQQGFSVLRLAMYGYEPEARDLVDCTLDTHVTDFETVVRHLRGDGVRTVFAVGHSYGGLTILKSAAALDGAVLWDPSHGLAWQGEIAARWRGNDVTRRLDGLAIHLAGKGYVYSEEADRLDLELGDTTTSAAGKGYPLKVISADRNIGILTGLGERYAAAADEPKAWVEIPGAGHNFAESDAIMVRLFDETASWFKAAAKQEG